MGESHHAGSQPKSKKAKKKENGGCLRGIETCNSERRFLVGTLAPTGATTQNHPGSNSSLLQMLPSTLADNHRLFRIVCSCTVVHGSIIAIRPFSATSQLSPDHVPKCRLFPSSPLPPDRRRLVGFPVWHKGSLQHSASSIIAPPTAKHLIEARPTGTRTQIRCG